MADRLSGQALEGRLFCLRARPEPWLEALARGLSALPTSRSLREGPSLWMRLGPQEWWCWSQAQRDWSDRLRVAATGHPHALVEIGDAQQAFEIQRSAQEILAQACELDFEKLPTDFASRTRCASFTVVIAGPGQPWRLWVEASLAQSWAQWMEQARGRVDPPAQGLQGLKPSV